MRTMSLFESLCIRDLKIYAIIRTSSSNWGTIEIKIEQAAQNLLKFKEKVIIKKCGEPSFLIVLTGANYSYKRNDGVYVVSIGTLKN